MNKYYFTLRSSRGKKYVIMPAMLMACICSAIVFTERLGNGSTQPEEVFIEDTGFGTEGKVVFSDGTAFFRSVAVQFDGKVVVAGGNRGNFALARYNNDGSPDLDFGSGGKVATDFGAFDYALAVAVQADGKIIAAGDSGGNFALARYRSDGSLDDKFGAGGKVISDIGGYDQVRAIALQADGKIVAAGGSAGANDNRFGLARYNGDGSSDHAFGKKGMVTIGSNGDLWAHSVAVQADGKIAAAGERVKGGESDFFLVRCRKDGSPDTDFGEGGKVTTDFGGNEQGLSMVLQADGKIVLAGGRFDGFCTDVVLARYHRDGHLDNGFGIGGKVISDTGSEGRGDFTFIQSDGKIMLPGGFAGAIRKGVSRVCSIGNGSLSAISGGFHFTASAACQLDSKIVVLGGGNGFYELERYTANPHLTAISGNSGKIL